MADPHMRVLEELPHATLRGYLNELAFDQKDASFDDPVKLRFGAFKPSDGRPNFYIAAISMDVLNHDPANPRREEKGFLALKLDPEPCLELFLQRTADTHEDRDMVKVLRISSQGAEIAGLRSAPSSARVSRFYTDGGKFCVNWQDDPNPLTGERIPRGIVYDTHDSTDESTWTAVGMFKMGPLPK